MASSTSADGVLPELQRELDAFVATHAAALCGAASQTPARAEIAAHGALRAPLARLAWMATALAAARLGETTQFALSWLAAAEGAGARRATAKCASWVVAYLVGEILAAQLAARSVQEGSEPLAEHVLDRCVVVFQETFQSDAARAIESGGGFFAFKPVVSHLRAPTLDDTLLESVALAWRHVAALVSLSSLAPLRTRLQKQLLAPLLQAKSASSKEYLQLKNLSELRLGLDVTSFLKATTVQQNVKDAALLLKMLQPLTLKPHKPPTRSAAIAAIASLLNRELDALNTAGFQKLYTSAHGVAEWTTSISELHAAALKLSGKREYAVAAWDLRVALLCISPNEIFSRYWKEDAHALLRVQYQQNKDGGGAGPHAAAVLECVRRCFSHILKRHFLNERRIPGELECMEIINTTQAWCFFAYPKQKSLQRLNAQVIPVLVQISVGIASYNMLYSIQSHVRRLVLEADHIFDEKKLVGLEAMLAVCDLCMSDGHVSEKPTDASLPLDRKLLYANRSTLGDLVGQTLIEANALFGGDLLIESTTAQGAGSAIGVRTANLPASAANKLLRDEYRRAIAIQSYACALRSLKHLYAALQLSDDQKILILVRSCIHNETSVRASASEALHAVITGVSRQAGVIFRGVTDYIFRLSNHLTTPRDFDAFLVLIELTTSLLRSVMDMKHSGSSSINVAWDSRKAKQESLLQVESVAVYLLVFEDPRLLEAAVTALEVVAQLRAAPFMKHDASVADVVTVERPSVIDVLRKADWELQEMLFSFEQVSVVESFASKDLGCFRHLIAELEINPRASFRWSSCLAVVFAQLATWNPEVAAFMWSDVNDKVTKLEPAMPSMLECDSSSGSFDLARWRNLAVLATTTACPHLVFQSNDDENESVRSDTDDMKDYSVQSVISSSVVQALLKRLCRFLKSPSVDQKKAVILALGSTHVSSLPILMEVLQKYEPEAFTPVEAPPSGSRHGSMVDISPVVPMPMNGNVNGLGMRRATKEQKARNLKATAQLQLQWALGRCYRLVLHTTMQRPLLFDDTTREAVLRLQTSALNVIDKLATVLSHVHHSRDAPHHFVFMMQQDFCSSVRALASLSEIIQSPYSSIRKRQGTLTRDGTGSIKKSRRRSSISSVWRQQQVSCDNESVRFDVKQREAWYALLLNWCHSFSSLANARLSSNLSGSFFAFGSPAREHWMQRCDVFGERVDDSLIPWQWVDEGDATRALGIQEAAMASFQRFFLCQAAFATLPVIVIGPLFLPTPITPDAGVFRWLDECFAVEVGDSSGARNGQDDDDASSHHFEILQAFCHRILGAFLQSDFRAFIEVCVDKSFFSVSSGDKHNVAKHYFQALCGVSGELKHVFRDLTTADSGLFTKEATVHQRPSIRPTTSLQNLQVRVCHVMLMHLGIEGDAAQRQRAAQLMNELYGTENHEHEPDGSSFQLSAAVSSAKRSNAAFGAQVMNRMQIAGASFLVQKLGPLSYQMSMSILKFLSCCEAVQQKKMLVVVLPWLAEVSLVAAREVPAEPRNLPSAFDSDQLLSLLFRITTNLGVSCCDQLEQAWLTLAFAAPNPPGDTRENPHRESNLARVIQFLFLQRTTSVRLATAKLVVWWLCRWHSAAHEVLREALLLVETRRRESAAAAGPHEGETALGPTIQPVDDVFVFVILLSDSCCHLTTVPAYLYQQPALREAMMVQAVHFAFLALFALALDPRSFAVRRTVASRSGGNMEDHQQQSLYVDASNDCLVLIRNLLGQLQGPVELLSPIVEELAAWSKVWEEQATTSSEDARRNQKPVRQLERAMASFASCLPPSLRNTWALECVKEIALALVPGSTLLQQTSSRCNNTQVLYCVRFGLLGYRVLAPEFHGDVFLTLLDLLHHALDEHARDPANAGAVLAETLAALQSMVACMPPQKLVLYPQILWVCVALLNHGKSETLSFQTQIVELLAEILRIPHFATNQLLQDVLMAKKPLQWSDDQASVLRTVVWSLDRSSLTTQRLTLELVSKFLVLPSPVFHTNSIEHLVTCTMVLAPFIVATAMHIENQSSDTQVPETQDCEEDESEEEEVPWTRLVDALQQVVDLQFAWLAVGSEQLSDALSRLQSALSHDNVSPEEDENSEKNRSLVAAFAVAFVAELVALGGNETESLVTMCFEILVKLLAAEDIRKRQLTKTLGKGGSLDTQDTLVTATLWIVEAMVAELGRHKLAWRPTSVLLGSLARLVRVPEQTQTWQAAVRIMNCLGPSNRSTSATNAVRLPSQLAIATNSTSPDGPSATVAPLSCDSPSKPSSNARVAREDRSSASGAGTPGKKDAASGARKFMNLMGHRGSATSSTHSSPSHNQTTHTAALSPSATPKQSSDPAEEPCSRRDL